MSEQIVKTAKDPLVALAESVERTVLHGWRWFIDDTWIVFEVPGLSEITLLELKVIAEHTRVMRLAAVFRSTPHAGIYVRFQRAEA